MVILELIHDEVLDSRKAPSVWPVKVRKYVAHLIIFYDP